MLRLLFEKKDNAVWISHLDLMRLFQRAFKRAGLPLTHTKGFNPRPSVSIALPLSVGVTSGCELLDFELDGLEVSCEEIRHRLNGALIDGVRVLEVYADGRKLKDLALLQCSVILEYNHMPNGCVGQIQQLFAQEELLVEKKSKNGIQEQNIIPMIRTLEVAMENDNILCLQAVVHCQNPSLNPMQLVAAIERYLPQLQPDFSYCCRQEIYDESMNIFR